jgi:predicted RNA-binding protein
MSENKIEKKKLRDLIPDRHNANKGTLRGSYMLGHSLETFGAGRSLLVDRDLNIIAGNKTHAKAGELGLEDVVLVHVTGDQLVAVVRDDLHIDSPEARGLAVADNRAGEMDLAWDGEELARMQLEGVDLDSMFSEAELQKLISADVEFIDGLLHDNTPGHTARMIELFLTEETEREFLELVAHLQNRYGTHNPTDTVLEALRQAFRSANGG